MTREHQLGEQLGSGVAEGGLDGADAVARDPEPVPRDDGAHVAARVPHRLSDLAGDDVGGRLGHLTGVHGRIGLGVVGQESGEALGDPLGGHDVHGLGGVGVDLLCDRDDVLVVRQDDDVVGRHRLHGLDQLGRRRVHGLSTGDDPLHPE